jgi:hypothetical protein
MTHSTIGRAPAGLAAAALAAAGLLLSTAGGALAHTVEHAGSFTLEIGWQHEPTYVGDPNGIQVTVSDSADKPVTDLGLDDLKVVVLTGTQQSPELTFEPAFDLEEMEGPMGEYDAAIVPTAPGDYSFHVTGTIHGQAVDVNVTSGEETFDPVRETGDLQFPTKLPSMAEVATRLDRVDSRIATLQTGSGPTQAAVDDAQAKAVSAQAAADRALLVGGGIGALGLLVGAAALLIAMRRSPRTTV